MTRLDGVLWLSAAQVKILVDHRIVTLEELAQFETADSFADQIPLDGLRQLSRRARQALAHPDPMEQLGAAVGQRPGTPVAYAGGVTFDGKG